jgi:hypothetical protein
MTYNRENLNIYVNGKLMNSVPLTTGLVIGTITVDVGWDAAGGVDARHFNGLIDEVRIYSEALSSGELQKHYTEGLKNHQNFVLEQ